MVEEHLIYPETIACASSLSFSIQVSPFEASVPRVDRMRLPPPRGEVSSSCFQLRLHFIANSNEILQEHDRGYIRLRVSSRSDTVSHEEQSTNLP